MNDRREYKTAHTGPLGRIDHAFTDLSLIGQKSWSNIEDGVNVLQRRVKALSVMQIPEFGRQIIYGVVIIGMLLLYGRERLLR